MKIDYKVIDLHLEKPLQLSYGLVQNRQSLIVALTIDQETGYGEMTFIDYYNISKDQINTEIESFSEALETYEDEGIASWHDLMNRAGVRSNFLRSALDTAYYDARSSMEGSPFYDYIGFENPEGVTSCVTITGADLKDEERLNELLQWPILKVKAGYDGDEALLDFLYAEYDGQICIDANRGWTVDKTIAMMKNVKLDNLLFLEEPLSGGLEDMPKLNNALEGVKMIADESFQSKDDLETISKNFHGVNLKLMKCGGIYPGIEILTAVKEREMLVLGGCMMSSAISVLPIVHFSSELDFHDFDGSLTITDSRIQGLNLDRGKVKILNPIGMGMVVEGVF